MARNPKRSQARRKRPSKPKPGDAAARAEDIGLDAGSAEEAGIGNMTPNELEGAVPYVDEAHLAEAGADVPGPNEDDFEGEDDLDRAPDEVEGDLVPVGTGAVDPAVLEERELARGRRKQRGRLITFFGHCIDELRRVQWPNRRQVGQATAVVLGFVVLAGGYLGLMDAIWKPIVKAII